MHVWVLYGIYMYVSLYALGTCAPYVCKYLIILFDVDLENEIVTSAHANMTVIWHGICMFYYLHIV